MVVRDESGGGLELKNNVTALSLVNEPSCLTGTAKIRTETTR